MRLSVFLLFIVILFGCKTQQKALDSTPKQETFFFTNQEQLTISVNGKIVSKWTISPDLKPDVFEADCTKKENTVTFSDKADSISFVINVGESKDFFIINSKKDTAFTRITGVLPNHNFTAEYIAANKGKTKIAITEVSELANILVALHPDAEKDKNMTNSDSDYYKRVKAYFEPYVEHQMMDTIQKYIKEMRKIDVGDEKVSIFSDEGYYYYYALKMNACTYEFNENDEIVNEGYIREMAKDWSAFDPFKDKELIEDFAKKSNFRAFYKENQAYYDEIITTYKTLNPISQMQTWLDKKFGFTYGNYTIYFSPLVNGAHSTRGFDTEEFRQTFMFIACAEFDKQYTQTMNELLESRVVFTEIDHNYVNPTSAKYLDKIDAIFSDRETWAKEELTTAYPTPSKVFNEYMTFAVYTLYVSDLYEEEDLLAFLPKMEKLMEVRRGYIKFKDFNRTLLKHYKENPNKSMEEYYEFILDWSEKQ